MRSTKSFAERAKEHQLLRNAPYEIITLDLATARDRLRFAFAGDVIHVLAASSDAANVHIRFANTSTSGAVIMQRYRKVVTYFTEIYLTNAAQVGSTITLLLANSDYFDVEEHFPGGAGSGVDPVRIHDGTDTMLVSAAGAASVDPVDRAARLLGVAYGSQSQQLQQRAASFELLVQLASAGSQIDPRAIQSVLSGKTLKFASISAAATPNNTLVAAVAAKKIKLRSMWIVAAADVTMRLEDGAGGSALSGQMDIAQNGGFVLPAPAMPDEHWLETSVNTLLNLELSGAVQCSGALTYFEEA